MSIDGRRARRIGVASTLATFVLLACSRTGVGSARVAGQDDGGEADASQPITCPSTSTPVELARTAKSSAGIRIAVSPTHVYWWDSDHEVHRVPKCGGPAELVTTGLYYISDLTFHWGTLFVADAVGQPRSSGRILAVDGGLTRIAVDHIDEGPSELASDDRGVYYLWGAPHSNSLLRLDWPSQTTTVLATNMNRFVIGGPYAYAFRPPDMFAIPLAGGPPIPLDGHGVEPLAADDSGVYYYAGTESEPTLSIRRVAVGSPFEVVVPDVHLSVPFGAIDATQLYVPESRTFGTPPNKTSFKGVVLAISKSTKEVRDLATTRDGEFIEAIADDDASIYWIEYSDGRLMKLAK